MTVYMLLFFFAIAILAFLVEWGVVKTAYKKGLFDKPNERKIHTERIPRLGGVVIFPILLLGMALLLMTNSRLFHSLFSHNKLELLGIFSSVAIVYICGFVDDLFGIRYRNKFIAQILSGLALCSCGLLIDNLHGFMGIGQIPVALAWVLTIFTVIYVSNAINFIDGIDGLAGCLSLIALGCYAVMFRCFGLKGLTFICCVAIVAVVALLTFNMHGKPEKYKVFMGDAGSLTLGVLLCVCGIITLRNATHGVFTANNPFLVATMPLALPCFDVVRVVLYRLAHGTDIFKADKSHIHHKLLNLGLTQRQALYILLALDLCMIVLAFIMTPFLGVNLTMLIEIVLFLMVNWIINRKLNNKEI